MNIILISLRTLPKLVNGKVAVINNDNTYDLFRPSKNCIIEDDFNPLHYCILISEKYSKCIVYSTRIEMEEYLVNKQLRETKLLIPYRVGDKIHIHSRRGIYEIVEIQKDYVKITCKKWSYDKDPYHLIAKSDFKCLAGGIYNQTF